MTVFNLGSINIDHFYDVMKLPGPGETVSTRGYHTGLGGKGANQSVAIAKAGGSVCHIGAVGPDGAEVVERLSELGVDTTHIVRLDAATGHAIVLVDQHGENSILVHPGANYELSQEAVFDALEKAKPGDWLLFQNETNNQQFALEQAQKRNLNTAYVAAPFDPEETLARLPFVDLLILNSVEMVQLKTLINQPIEVLGVRMIVVTDGASGGVIMRAENTWREERFSSRNVDAVDTAGAGDTFAGFLLAGLDGGTPFDLTLQRSVTAAALQVTKKGTADAIPSSAEVDGFAG